jgi:asparagine synthase (glutamine-hydrolysing)
LAFASELSALREIPWYPREIDPAALGEYLRWGYVPAPMTIYQGVSKFAPATHRTFLPGESRSSHYFDPNIPVPSPRDPVAATQELVHSAVERQLVSDVPLGCFLSGGMDSSIIAAAMQASLGDRPAMTFSIGFDDPRYDETQYAAAVAKHLGTEHRQFTVRPDAATDLPALAAVFGEPFGDSSALPTHYLARETRHHVKVALSGDGGDELFGGYDRYRAVQASNALSFVPFARQVFAASIWKQLPGSHPKSRVARMKRFAEMARFPDAMEGYRSTMALFDPTLLNALFLERRAIAERTPEPLAPSRTNPVEMALALDRITYLPGDLLTKIDRCSMLHALEVRSPFMDHELVSFAAGLNSGQLLSGGPKRMLREAFADDLPAWVFKRKKMGFAIPIGEWFRGPLRALLRDSLFASDSFAASHFHQPVLEKLVNAHEAQAADHSQRLYALLMLELWWCSAR